jgi:putative Holliday junction resolvase
MSRIMALDVGEVTLGVAVSDALGICAQPVKTLRRSSFRKDLRAIADLIREHEVSSIVIGLPLRLAGDVGPAADGAMAFAEKLRVALQVPVVTWDERLTTVQAERALLEGDVSRRRRREVINQVAAAIILQSYLDSRSA